MSSGGYGGPPPGGYGLHDRTPSAPGRDDTGVRAEPAPPEQAPSLSNAGPAGTLPAAHPPPPPADFRRAEWYAPPRRSNAWVGIPIVALVLVMLRIVLLVGRTSSTPTYVPPRFEPPPIVTAPLALPKAAATGTPPSVGPLVVSRDATEDAYWFAGGSLHRRAGAGLDQMIALEPLAVQELAVAESRACWITRHANITCMQDTRKPFGRKASVKVDGTASGLAIDAESLYFVETAYDGVNQRLIRSSLSADADPTRVVLTSGTNLHAPALDATHVYLSRGGNLLHDEPVEIIRVAKRGGPAQVLAPKVHIRGTEPFFVADGDLYFTTIGADEVTDLARMPKTGGAPRTVDLGGAIPDAFTVTGKYIYFTTEDDDVRRVARGGGKVEDTGVRSAAFLASAARQLVYLEDKVGGVKVKALAD